MTAAILEIGSRIGSMKGIVFFCHGARQASWRVPFDEILAEFRRQCPQIPAQLAFLEMMSPGLIEAVEMLVQEGADEVDVIPLFLAPGGHTQRDLPELLAQVRQRWPQLQLLTRPTLTESTRVRQAIVETAFAQAGAL